MTYTRLKDDAAVLLQVAPAGEAIYRCSARNVRGQRQGSAAEPVSEKLSPLARIIPMMPQ